MAGKFSHFIQTINLWVPEAQKTLNTHTQKKKITRDRQKRNTSCTEEHIKRTTDLDEKQCTLEDILKVLKGKITVNLEFLTQ